MNGTRAAVAPAVPRAVVRTVAPDTSRTWRRISIAAVAGVSLLDAGLLQRKHGLFTGGFLASHQFGTTADGVAFLMMLALLNAAIAAPLVLAALVAGRLLRLRPAAAQFSALCAAVVPLTVASFLTYKIWTYLGDLFDFHVMYALTGHRISEVFAVTAPLMARPLFVFALALAGIAGVTAVLHRLDPRDPGRLILPPAAVVLKRCLVLILLSSALVTAVCMSSDSMGFGLRWTPAGQLFTTVLNRLSDFDRDGYGLLRNPRDPAPFDASIHPYAIDIPGNGIDENGLAGDLPLDRAVYHEPPLPKGAWPERPPVVLFVLESARADVVGARHDGQRVTPVLDALAGDGVRIEHAWSHAGSTVQSRLHILTGSLIAAAGSRTLLDDFKDQGYDVAYFSGQDEVFGSTGIDFSRVDRFYDARQDVGRRYSASTTPGSLAVPHSVVEERIREYLTGRRPGAPLFLYVNFHDTHYPYTHAGLENLLGVEALPAASLISPARRPELLRTYLNTMANVDRAIGRVIEAVETHAGERAAVVVISDHGESLFDEGVLGHGFALNDVQTRVPLIVRGLPARITVPFGQIDLRRTINEALARQDGRDDHPVARHGREARVFQYLGTLDTPSQIGWMAADGPFTYDFRSDRVGVWDSSVRRRDLTGEPARRFVDLVHTWESMILARSRGAASARHPSDPSGSAAAPRSADPDMVRGRP